MSREEFKQSRQRGLPSWLSTSGWSHKAQRQLKPEDSATPEQREALHEYRSALRIKAHSWTWLPFDTAIAELAGSGSNDTKRDPEEASRLKLRSQIWADLLSERSSQRSPGRRVHSRRGKAAIAVKQRLRPHSRALMISMTRADAASPLASSTGAQQHQSWLDAKLAQHGNADARPMVGAVHGPTGAVLCLAGCCSLCKTRLLMAVQTRTAPIVAAHQLPLDHA
jgi:hypothetical protein